MNWTDSLRDFITLWVVIDPIGTIPVFLASTAGLEAAQRRAVAIRGIIVATAILLFFLICGQFLLEAMGISLISFQIAGGIVLLLFALTMIFGPAKPTTDLQDAPADHMQSAVFPVAIPSIASPGAMLAIVLLTDNHRFSAVDQAMTGIMLGGVLLATLVFMLAASPIHKLIGTGGENIISRVMGMVLAAVAVDSVLTAFTQLGWIDPQLFTTGM